jgi:hypothetical protein
MQRCLLLLSTATALFAAQTWEGTWKRNAAKSQQSQVFELTCDLVPGGYRLSFTGRAPDLAILDGKERRLTSPSRFYDTESWTRVDERSIEQVFKKDGKVVSTERRVVSADGKQMKQTIARTGLDRRPEHFVYVYDKMADGSASAATA